MRCHIYFVYLSACPGKYAFFYYRDFLAKDFVQYSYDKNGKLLTSYPKTEVRYFINKYWVRRAGVDKIHNAVTDFILEREAVVSRFTILALSYYAARVLVFLF